MTYARLVDRTGMPVELTQRGGVTDVRIVLFGDWSVPVTVSGSLEDYAARMELTAPEDLRDPEDRLRAGHLMSLADRDVAGWGEAASVAVTHRVIGFFVAAGVDAPKDALRALAAATRALAETVAEYAKRGGDGPRAMLAADRLGTLCAEALRVPVILARERYAQER
jgi:hypothetical protein